MATIEKRTGRGGKVTWRVRVRRAGGSDTRSFAKKSDAEQWARAAEHKVDTGEALPTSEARKVTLSTAIDEYIKTLDHAPRNKDQAKRKALLTWWREELGTRRLSSITRSVIAETRDRLKEKSSRLGGTLAGATVNRHLAALSAVMKFAVKEREWISKNPVLDVRKLGESKGRERFLDEDERTALLRACAKSDLPELLPIVQLALATGARRGEIIALDWSRLDLDARRMLLVDTKNSETRAVPLAEPAVAALRAWRKDRLRVGVVFPAPVHRVEEAWQQAKATAGLHDLRFHDLRHTAASYLAMSGATLLEIAAILGHKTLAMVKRYSHLSEQHTTAAIDRMAAKFLK